MRNIFLKGIKPFFNLSKKTNRYLTGTELLLPMTLKKYFLLVFLLLPGIFPVGAQYSVTGRVMDKTAGKPLSDAHIILGHTSDTLKYAVVSTGDGTFFFSRVHQGKYLLQVIYLGYKTYQQPLTVEHDTHLGDILLEMDSLHIGEVTVTGQIPMAEQIGDTTQYNAMAYKTTQDASAENLVEKMPGIVIEDGKVQAHGEDVKEVLVDGRPFFDRDPMAALRNLPAEVIEKIQIYDKQSEQAEFTGFEDGNTRKVMNIITRVGMRNGTFGRIYAGYGTDNRYMAGGNINKFNKARRISVVGQSNNLNRQNFSSEDLLGVMSSSRLKNAGRRRTGGKGGGNQSMGGSNTGDFLVAPQNGITQTHALGINYSDEWGEKVEVTGSYFFNRTHNTASQLTNRNYISDRDSGQVYNEQEETGSFNTNHRFNLRLAYKINENNSILFRPRLTLQFNDGTSDVSGLTYDERRMINQTDNSFSSRLNGLNYSGMLLFRHRFKKKGRTFSININSGYNQSGGENAIYSINRLYKDTVFLDISNQQATLDANAWSIQTNLMYTEPVGKRSMIEVHYQQSYRPGISDKETWNYDPSADGYTLLDTLLSNKFDSRYSTREIGTGYLYHQGKLNLTTRISAESSRLERKETYPAVQQITNHYLKLQGLVLLRYRMGLGKNLNIVYRTNTSPPSVSQMQEVLDNTDPLHLRIGNASLSPSFKHNLFFRYSTVNRKSSSIFFIFLNGSMERNAIVSRTWTPMQDTTIAGNLIPAGIQLTRPVNVNGQWSIRNFITYGFPVLPIKSNLNLNFSASYNRNPGYINQSLNVSNNTSFSAGIVLSSNISENLDFTLSSRSKYNIIRNSLQKKNNYNYFIQNTRARLKWIFWRGFTFSTDVSQKLYTGLSSTLDQNYWIWNLGFGYKLFKDKKGEISLNVFDLLNQNQSISRKTRVNYVEDVQTEVLQRFFMLTFSYNLRSFPEAKLPPPGRPPFRKFKQ